MGGWRSLIHPAICSFKDFLVVAIALSESSFNNIYRRTVTDKTKTNNRYINNHHKNKQTNNRYTNKKERSTTHHGLDDAERNQEHTR